MLLRLIKLATNSNAYKSSDSHDEGDELDSDGSIEFISFAEEDTEMSEEDTEVLEEDTNMLEEAMEMLDNDTEMLDGNKACSLPCSYLSEQEPQNNPPPTKISSIQNALEIAEKYPTSTTKAAGILKYFKKATEDEIREQNLRQKDEWEFTQHNNEYLERIAGIRQQNRKRDLAKERQRHHRMKKKHSEIEERIRSPGGTKKRVCNRTQGFRHLLMMI